MFCSIAANEKWLVEASDVNAAFLQSDPIDREIYIYPPPERAKDGFIWKLIKPVYGLKDSSRQWYKTMEKYLLNLGMKQSYRDSCLFSFRKKDALMGIILLHVDDMLSCGNHQFYESIIKPLRAKFTFGKIESRDFIYTGLHFQQNDQYEIFIDQDDFVEKIDEMYYEK